MARAPSLAFARIRAEVLAAAEAVPPGRVTTYGAIAAHLEASARHVAYALAGLDEAQARTLPWHRVVAEGGGLRHGTAAGKARQRDRLRAEGVGVTTAGAVKEFDRLVFRWPPRPEHPGTPTRGPYSDPATPPLFPAARRHGYR